MNIEKVGRLLLISLERTWRVARKLFILRNGVKRYFWCGESSSVFRSALWCMRQGSQISFVARDRDRARASFYDLFESIWILVIGSVGLGYVTITNAQLSNTFHTLMMKCACESVRPTQSKNASDLGR